MGSMCCCKDLVKGTPHLAVSQGVNVFFYEQQNDGSFALLESASANNFDVGQFGGQVDWRIDDKELFAGCPTKTSTYTLLQRDPLKEHYFQGVEDPELGGASPHWSQGGTYLSTSQGFGNRGPKTPQTANSPAGWVNPAYVVTHAGAFASTNGASGEPLIATNYGDFSVPSFPPTITITGVGLTIRVSVDIGRDVFDDGIFLTLDGSTPVGTDQSHPYNLLSGDGTWCPLGSAFQETRGYGSVNSGTGPTQKLWGLPSLTVDQIQDPNFGVIFLMKSNSGAGQGYIQSWELLVSFQTNSGHIYTITKSSTYAPGPCNKVNITSNVGPVGLQDTSRLRSGATVQVMNSNRTCEDNWYTTWAGTGLSVPPLHPRATTKTSPGVLCEWTDPTLTAYFPNSDGQIACWSGDDFVIAPPANFGPGAATYSGTFCYTFDGSTFALATADTITLPSNNPFGWGVSKALFAVDGIHGAFALSSQYLYLCQRSGSNLGGIAQFTFVGIDIGDVNHTIATAGADVWDISHDGAMLAFRATNGGSLPDRVHVYNAAGSVLAVLVPANINPDERIKQVNFSDDGKALAIATTNGLSSPAHGRTSVWTTSDGGSTWTEIWQRMFQSDGAAFAHGYRVPA